MRTAEFAQETLKTSACSARLMKYTSPTWQNAEEVKEPWKRPTYYGDAWFGSVPSVVAAAQNNCNLVCVVKNAHRQYPKKFLEDTMKEWPPGSNLVLQTMLHGVHLYAVGYKYLKGKVLCFLYNKGAGTIQPGKPYVAKWKDRYGNTNSKYVPRPNVVSRYFADLNVIDSHNQSRQYDLHLEKCWVTRCGYFRLATTLFGICVVDSWKAYRHHMNSRHRHYDIGLMDYVSILCKDMLNNKFSRLAALPPDAFNVCMPSDNALGPAVGMIVEPEACTAVPENEQITQDSYLDATVDKEPEDIPARKPEVTHNLIKTNQWTKENVEVEDKDSGEVSYKVVNRRKRGICFFCKKKTAFYCPAC